jgi:hypothetical protein
MPRDALEIELPTADDAAVRTWAQFLHEDARKMGGTASVVLNYVHGGAVRVTAAHERARAPHVELRLDLVIIERLSRPVDAAMARAQWLADLNAELGRR